jgi:probable addiction module antidote protein
MKHRASVSNDEVIIAEIRDNPEFAASYLAAAMENTDQPGVLLIALRQIAEARGGMTKIAKDAGLQRESLYRALSKRGNPRLTTLLAVIQALGMTLTVGRLKEQ